MRYFLIITALVLSPGMLTAQSDRTEVRRGNQAFSRERYATAELEYRRALEKDSTSVTAHYNLNNAKYKQDRYEQAEDGLKARMDSLVHPEQRADAFHNLGNAQLMQKKYAESIDSYKESLRLRPRDMETKSNLAYAQKMLKEQEEQEQNQEQDEQEQDDQEQDQNQDNQNQNQDEKEQEAPPKITPQSALQMLEAMQQKERETQERISIEKAKAQQQQRSGRNW
ncbi:MAG: tetratricopeptide repeat protein [Bacteroidales bacterium]|nr:tetratricopeptide repeat protein [Bacteroidales bacterium]MCL2737943.1 tetratricopeptide repeat protein [Bacteroidales bacterium]